MQWHRISAIVLHAWYHFLHSKETWIDLFWFPVINLFAVGGLSFYVGRLSGGGGQYVQFVTVGVLFWHIIEVGSYSIAVGALWEVWARSFSTMFISPLSLNEFVAGHIIFSFCKQLFLFTFLSIIVSLVFRFSLVSVGPALPLYILLLGMYGWAFGMFVFGLILRLGSSVQSLAWGLVYILQPLIGVYYPVHLLPLPVQRISYALAPTYVFESVRAGLTSPVIRWDYLGKAAALDIVALVFCYSFMRYMWEWARKTGALARMEQ